jgi:5-formyltetrahydrofolate cyclo-ligase
VFFCGAFSVIFPKLWSIPGCWLMPRLYDKESIRRHIEAAPVAAFNPGLVAECLRKQDVYRRSSILFVSPVPALQQVRINALVDGKTLVLPGPAIKKGFYRLKPYAVAFKDLGHAVSLQGLESFGTLLSPRALARLHIDLALTDCLAVAPDGGRLGRGTGFFDLAMAILAELGGVDDQTVFGAVGAPEQLMADILPQDSWDVPLHFFVAGPEPTLFTAGGRHLRVEWQALEKKRIRKIEPLWQLFQAAFPEQRK